jgi:hypothetical protein
VTVILPLAVALAEIVIDVPGTNDTTVAPVGIPVPDTVSPINTPAVLDTGITGEPFVVVPVTGDGTDVVPLCVKEPTRPDINGVAPIVNDMLDSSAVAGNDITKEVLGLIETIVAPTATPEPDTVCPGNIFVVLLSVTIGEPPIVMETAEAVAVAGTEIVIDVLTTKDWTTEPATIPDPETV